MADYLDYRGYGEPEKKLPDSAQIQKETDTPIDPAHGASPDLASVEVESLKRELALYQTELDVVHEQVASMKRENQALAESVRREGEAKAREIIRQALAEAELLELRASVRAERTRAREVARLWSRLDSALEAAKEGGNVAIPEQVSPVSPRDQQMEAIKVEPEMTEGTGEERVAAPMAQPSMQHGQGEAADETEMAEETGEPAESPTVEEESQPAEEKAASAELDSGLAAATTPSGSEGVPASTTQPSAPEVRRYRVRGPISFGSMVAIEQAAGRIPGVLSAKVSPSPDGGAILIVSTQDPDGTEMDIKQIPHLSWQLEDA